MSVRHHVRCRCCGGPLNLPYLNLGEQPLANALRDPLDTSDEFVAPLCVSLCPGCGLSQLTAVVDPKVLYTGYRFRSGASEPWKAHCEQLAVDATLKLMRPGLVVDIAANDGTCLKAFLDRGWDTIGVEPAEIEPVAHVGRMERAFWSFEVADRLKREHRSANLIIAQNVLGHVDSPITFLRACHHLLADEGFVVVEVPHVRELINQTAFDTIYHEHLSYWNTTAMIRAAHAAGLVVDHIDPLREMHGGSRRYWLTKADPGTVWDEPKRTFDETPYKLFAVRVEDRLAQIARELHTLAFNNQRVVGYGASAKGTVLLNALKAYGNVDWPEAIVDDTPEKQGLVVPGVRIPIVDAKILPEVDVVLVQSWNWAKAIQARARVNGFTGRFLITAPEVRYED